LDYARAGGRKLYEQFCSLKASFPHLRPTELAAHATIIGPIRVPSSASVNTLADGFEGLKLPLSLPNVLVVDHPTFEVELRTQYGSELKLTLSGAPPNDAVASWVDRAIQLSGGVAGKVTHQETNQEGRNEQ
jgi:hypothetical protein